MAAESGQEAIGFTRCARQVGKTTAVNMFAKTFESYIYLNLEKAEDRTLFVGDIPFTDTLARIFLPSGKERISADTLIFIDEIQKSS